MTNEDWRLESYDFDLPPELIAQHPASQRDASRLTACQRARRLGSWFQPLFLEKCRDRFRNQFVTDHLRNTLRQPRQVHAFPAKRNEYALRISSKQHLCVAHKHGLHLGFVKANPPLTPA